MKKYSTNNFTKGIQADLDKSLQTPDTYLYSENFRLVATKSATSGSLENIQGTLSRLNLPTTVVGYCNVRDELIIFGKYPTTGDVVIYKATADDNGVLDAVPIYSSSTLSFGDKVVAVGRYENDYVKKVYFTDELNTVRFFNYADPTFSSWTDDRFNFIQKVVFTNPVLDSIVTGSLKVGKVSYVYKLYNLNGAETFFSSPIEPYHITKDSEYLSSGEKYKGYAKDTITNKGYIIKIPFNETFRYFNKLELVALHYQSYYGVPEIRILDRVNISYSTTNSTYNYVNILDSGQSIGSYSLDELTVMNTSLFNARQLTTKNNYLFAGNITEDYFDIDETGYDTRAYRFADYTTYSEATIYNDANHRILLRKEAGVKSTNAQIKSGVSWITDTAMVNSLSALGDISTNWVVPATYNCINKFNDSSLDTNLSEILQGTYCIYQSNGTTLGGEGLNVSYSFKLDTRLADSVPTGKTYSSNKTSILPDFTENKSTYQDYSSPWYNNHRSFHRDEVYRCYVVATDIYGRDSFPKWIADIRTPEVSTVSSTVTYTKDGVDFYNYQTSVYGATTSYNILKIQFSIRNVPNNIVSLKITYVPRTAKDKTILGQGLLASCFQYRNVYRPDIKIINTVDNIYTLVSPEINILNNISYVKGDYVKSVCGTNYSYYNDFGYGDLVAIYRYPNNVADTTVNNKYLSVYDLAQVTFDDNHDTPITITGSVGNKKIKYQNQARLNSSEQPNHGFAGTRVVLTTTSSLTTIDDTVIVNYKRNIINTQYGGNTYQVRQNNISIACSDTVPVTSNTIINCSGDTYIGIYDYLHSGYDSSISNPHLYIAFLYFPVETSVNLNMRLDDSFHRLYADPMAIYIKEKAGKHYKGEGSATDDVNYFVQDTNMYAYNDIYSKLNDIKQYTPKPVDWKAQKKFDCMVKYSDVKVNGEDIDSWTKFKSVNYIEVDSANGELTNLLTFNNYLYFWQPEGFGNLAVNPRSLLTDNTGMELTLGAGGVLDRYDYFNTGAGCSIHNSVINSNFGIYWYDSINKDIYKYSTDEQPLSKLKGIRTLLNNLNSVHDCVAVNDKSNNEILLSIKSITDTVLMQYSAYELISGIHYAYLTNNTLPLNIGDKFYIYDEENTGGYLETTVVQTGSTIKVKSLNPITINLQTTILCYGKSINTTICYNEFADAFTSIYTYNPDRYILLNNFIYSTNYNGTLWQHNVGDMCKFYGTLYPSKVKLLVNTEYDSTKVFDNISLFSTTTNSTGNNIIYDTFNKIRAYNDYQNTDYVTLTAGDINSLVRKERSFNLQIPRNKVNKSILTNPNIFDTANLSTNKEFAERMRDKYIIIDLIYNNTNNYKFNVPYVNTYYRTSIR